MIVKVSDLRIFDTVPDFCEPIFRNAIADQLIDGMVSEILSLLADDGIPLVTMVSVVKLILLLCEKEDEFIQRSLASNNPCSASMVNQISLVVQRVFKISIL